jgi:hypothetical protein
LAYWQADGKPITVSGMWKVHFTEGAPLLPRDYQSATLGSWTVLGDSEARRFAGTGRYTIDFDLTPREASAPAWKLDLGKVCESARVAVNGRDLGTVFSSPFEVTVPSGVLRGGSNELVVEVTNLATNRIADLDRRGVKWKIFRDINIVGRDYHLFDASHWPLRDSGLIGPVVITPLKAETR